MATLTISLEIPEEHYDDVVSTLAIKRGYSDGVEKAALECLQESIKEQLIAGYCATKAQEEARKRAT